MPDLDWLKAVLERPEDAAAMLKRMHNRGNGTDRDWVVLVEAARVQTVAEAAIALAEFAVSKTDHDKTRAYDKAMGFGSSWKLYQETADRLVQGYKDACAREKGER